MKIFICPICQKPQECDDRVGDSCKVYHRACLDNDPEIVKVREFVQGMSERLKANQGKGLR